MADPDDPNVWETPKFYDKRRGTRNFDAEGPVDAAGKTTRLAAVVHPISAGEGQGRSEIGTADFLRRPHLRCSNNPSPYLLGSKTTSPATPAQECGSRLTARSLSQEHLRKFSPSHELELQSLRSQVQEIQNRLNGDVVGSAEYQQLLSEKLAMESALGAAEYELQKMSRAYDGLQRSSALTEEKMSQKIKDMTEKQQVLLEKYNVAAEELIRLTDYMQNVPTMEEHMQLQHHLSKQTSHMTHLSEKFNILSGQVKQLQGREAKLEMEKNLLIQEKEDLAVKLSLTEKVLSDIESQRALVLEEGNDTKEDLLWRLDQLEKELSSAKKLLAYRKQKIESVNKEHIDQERKYSEKLQKEVETGEKLREGVWQLQKELEEYKTNEQKMKTLIKNSEENQKKLEEHLELALTQVKNNKEMNTTINSLFSSLHRATSTLKDLVTVSQQISQGVAPDLSVLLNFSKSREESEGGVMSLEAMKDRLREVRELIQQLEDVRSALQDQFANQEASNMTCTQM